LTKLLDNYALRRRIIAYVKDEGSNFNIMIITLKSIVSCDMLGLEEIFRALVLDVHFPRFSNMLQQRKKFAKTYNMCQLNLFKEICKNAQFGQKNLERVGKNGKRHV
jgi:hypothetical protein